VKADKDSPNLAQLQQASRGVNQATAGVVASTISGKSQIEETGNLSAVLCIFPSISASHGSGSTFSLTVHLFDVHTDLVTWVTTSACCLDCHSAGPLNRFLSIQRNGSADLVAPVRNIFKILGCHKRETTQFRSQQARKNVLLQKDAPQAKSKHTGREVHLGFVLTQCCPSPGLGRFRVHSLRGWLIGQGTSGGTLRTQKFKSSGKQQLF
jgi:hypothetical protein